MRDITSKYKYKNNTKIQTSIRDIASKYKYKK